VWRRLIVLVLLVPAGCGTEGPVVGVAGDRAEVVGISDGDTIRVELADGTRERVRLIGINAPEMSQDCGQDAKDHLAAQLRRGSTVRLRSDRTQDRRDRFGRLLAYVEGPRDVGAEQVRAGWAQARRYDGTFERWDRYRRLDAAARDLWRC
jgi:endonuclease YncB( thermonuclease family)